MRLNRTGFTLLEVLVAVSILAIAVTVVMQIFSTNLRSLSHSEDQIKALIKAEESLKGLYLSPETVEGTTVTRDREGTIIRSEVTAINTDRTKDIPVSTYEISVTAFWQGNKKERSVTLRTYKTIEKRP